MASPRRNRLPLVGLIGLAWLLSVDLLTRIQAGPLSLSGALTLATAALCVLYLALFALHDDQSGTAPRRLRGAIPGVLVAFVVIAWLRLLFSPSTEGVQNVAVYTGFICAAVVGTNWAPPQVVATFLRRLQLVSVVIPAVFVAGTVAGVALLGERAFALSCILFAAILIPYRGLCLIYKLGPFLVVIAAFLSLSRTAAIITAALLIFMAVRGKGRYRIPKAGAFAGVVGAALYWAVTSYAPFRDRFLVGDQAASIGGLNVNTSGRTVLWDLTFESAKSAPLLGHGPGSASRLINGLFTNIAHPHNDYLRIYHDFGLVGVALFVIGLALLLGRVWKRARRTDEQIHWVAFIALLGVTAAALTDNIITYPFVMIPLGVIVGCSLAQPVPFAPPKQRRLIGIGLAPGPYSPASPWSHGFQRRWVNAR